LDVSWAEVVIAQNEPLGAKALITAVISTAVIRAIVSGNAESCILSPRVTLSCSGAMSVLLLLSIARESEKL
jgi:hypothetical protein